MIQLRPESTERSFTSLDALVQFLESERAAWHKVGALTESFRSLIDDLRRHHSNQKFDKDFAQRIGGIVEHRGREKKLIYSETLDGKKILELSKVSADTGEAAYVQMATPRNH